MSQRKKDNPRLMEIRIGRKSFLQELSAALGSVERRTTVPILSHVLLEATDKQISIAATDLNLSLRTVCPAEVVQEGSCAVPARKLYDYVRLLSEDEITLRVQANDRVDILAGKSKTKMVSLAKEAFPKLPSFPASKSIQLGPAMLRTLISRTHFAISDEESRYTLNGALLRLSPENFTMVATDGHRMAFVQTQTGKGVTTETLRYLIPKKAIVEINSLLAESEIETVHFAHDESTLFFAIGNRLLTSRQLTGQFPNYEGVLPKEHDLCVGLPAIELSRAIQRVSQFADERSHSIRLHIHKNQLCLKSSSAETGESEDLITTEYAGKTMTLAFNSQYLSDFLKTAGTGNVTFHFKAPDLPGELGLEEDKDYHYRYIVMPMRG